VRGLRCARLRSTLGSVHTATVLLRSLALLALLAVCRPAQAQSSYAEPSARDIVVAYNTGLHFSIAPGVFIPTHGGDVGFSIAGDMRYGFDLGALVLAPGVRLAGYFPPHVNIVTALATLRLVFPIGPFAPFVVGGAGPGYVSADSQTGLAYLGGGGFMVHIGTHFGIGAEASYQAITGTDFAALFFGPLLLLAF
jgi:hypothetical protein